jgi:hypothetical protein
LRVGRTTTEIGVRRLFISTLKPTDKTYAVGRN